jgi:hypothetical protein
LPQHSGGDAASAFEPVWALPGKNGFGGRYSAQKQDESKNVYVNYINKS